MNQEKIGKFIAEIRKKQNLTQKEFAEKYNVTYQAVSKWENGKSIPDISILKEICKENNINLDDLLDGKKTKKKKNYIIIIITIILLIFLGITVVSHKDNNDFQLKPLKTTCNDFNVYGSIAYNSSKTSISISNITYCGKNKNIKYKKLECSLYEITNNTKTKIDSYTYDSSQAITFEEFLKNINFKIDHHSKSCKMYKENTLHLEIEATEENSDKTELYKLPLTLEDNCKN